MSVCPQHWGGARPSRMRHRATASGERFHDDGNQRLITLSKAKELAWPLASSLSPEKGILARNLRFLGPSPIGDQVGADAFLETVLAPLRLAMPAAQKRPYIYFGGRHEGHVWVGTTGNIEGELVSPWLGIPASHAPGKLRFGEFYRFDGRQIDEIRCLFDIPGLASQAGFELLPEFGGAARIPCGPPASVGIVETPQDPELTAATRELVRNMIVNGCNRLVGSDLSSQGLDSFWHEDMAWHGPWGIGSAQGMDEFYSLAQEPSVRSFPGRRGIWPKVSFLAEGPVAGFVGWPSLVGEFKGEPFRGISPTGGRIGMNVMDFYTCRDGLLHENWVLIDLVRFASDCGVDLMARLPEQSPRGLMG